ncbi:DUF6932 family protein [Paraliobacillus zengyii]|uniref:DUF6932 family protein n=1 Tax=Paraliobacillus zengyii TaxID=2213194 RepID=UPI0013A6F3DE|nr:hypothetical protein [Paraliobacillus zengyii]
MPIPDLNKHGFLPEGVYDCSIEELEDIFTNIPNTHTRKKHFKSLLEYIEKIKSIKFPCYHLLIDGSYVTNKEEPSDIDIALITTLDFSPMDFKQSHLEVMHKELVKSKYGFNMYPVFYETESLREIINFYQGVKPPRQHLKKGILRVRL